jgi:hypothetical protein
MSMILNPYAFSGAAPPPPPPGDPYFANVVLLLHFDGSDGSTTFTDSSSTARTITPVGNAQIDTDVFKFGTSSGLFDGNDYVYAADDTDFDFGSDDFTIEAWCYVTNATSRTIVAKWTLGQQSWYLGAGGAGYGFYISTTGSNAILALPLTSWPSTSTWFYIAVVRDGADLKLYVDGVQQGSTYNISTTALYNGSGPVTVGDDAATNVGFTGNLAEVRITTGVARDVTTVPTAAFPDS